MKRSYCKYTRAIDLVPRQRNPFDGCRFGSQRCRDDFATEKPGRLRQRRPAASYFELLLSLPARTTLPQLLQASCQ
jgi:hypothetical protein